MKSLIDLAAGRMPGVVLQSCRLEGFGEVSFAREPIAALFRRYPDRLDDNLSVEGRTAACVASLDPDGPTLFADLHGGNIVRLWRLGAVVANVVSPPFIAVGADDDLSQSRNGPVRFEPDDHPELGADLEDAAQAAADLDLGLTEPPLRTRVFVRRAFTVGSATAALFGLSVLANGLRRQPLTFNVAALCYPGSAPRLVIDRAGLAAAQEAAWIPHS